MNTIHNFLLLFAILEVRCKEEYIPTLIWTSREFQGRKNVDYLIMKNVKSDLFEAYLMEILGTKKPLVMVYLEQDLGTHDFEWGDDGGGNSFPFLSKLTVNSRVDYFRSVESPYQIVSQLDKKGFNRKRIKPGTKFDFNEGDLLLMEFETIKTGRSEIIKNHDEQMEEIHRQLDEWGKSWIVVYTARHSREGRLPIIKQMSPWHVEEPFQEKSKRAISIYRDEYTGFALIIKGTLQLLLPSPKNFAVKNLENYTVASAKSLKNFMDFVIFFPNYTLTFHLNEVKGSWSIQGIKLLNGNGDSLHLKPRGGGTTRPKNKCYVQSTIFQTSGKPLVKVIVSKYKFLKLITQEEPCKKPYAFQITFCVILLLIICSVVVWNKILQKFNFSVRTKAAKISTEDLFSISSRYNFNGS